MDIRAFYRGCRRRQSRPLNARHPASSVTGKYDPTNKAHDPANPATWLIPSWKTSLSILRWRRQKYFYSNALEIASMASVYTWFTGWTDVDNFKSYIDELWQLSHGYSVTVGAVYYCDGCVIRMMRNQMTMQTEPALSAPSETSGESQAGNSFRCLAGRAEWGI